MKTNMNKNNRHNILWERWMWKFHLKFFFNCQKKLKLSLNSIKCAKYVRNKVDKSCEMIL